MTPRVNGLVSFWHASLPTPARRPSLPGSIDADVAIAGGGYTGLWTAYYLKRARPGLRIVVLERDHVGFGASGRNGGWLSDHFSTPTATIARSHGIEGVTAIRRALQQSIAEVVHVASEETIDADIVHSGTITITRGDAQERRLGTHMSEERAWGATTDDLVELDADELQQRIRIDAATAGAWSPHCARIQPAKLVLGLADAVERLGVDIFEQTAATSISPGTIETNRGDVHAPVTLSCLEGYTATLRGHRRDLLPMNSAMIVTDPLPPPVWDEIGWNGSELIGDAAHAYCYAQRTPDDRIAIGGRGIPYRYASRTDTGGELQPATAQQLHRQPGGAHASRPRARPSNDAHPPPMGRSPTAEVGDRTGPMARNAHGLRPLPGGGPARTRTLTRPYQSARTRRRPHLGA